MKRILKQLGAIVLLAGISGTTIYGAVLYQDRTEQVITKGAVHINDKLLMTDGWKNINLLKIDLGDSNIAIAPIESATGTQRQTILQMVQDSGAIAGVNADYFDMSTHSTPSLGMLIKDGSLSHGYNSNHYTLGIHKNMATFLLDQEGKPRMDYYGVTVKFYSKGTLLGAAGAKNNIPSNITRPIVIDRTYYQTTHDIVAKHKSVYTIVVQDDIITYMSKSGEGVAIPENGFAILVPQSMANDYYDKVQLGDDLQLQETLYLANGITEAVSNMKMGIGGSGLIMKNGEAYTGAAHSVTPTAKVARTVVATVKGTNELLLLTVDKSGSYKGASQSELVEILKRYNADSAMYFDGGGSTTFVSRNEGSSTVVLQNKPSGGAQRKVINGVGLFTTSKTESLSQLILKTDTKRSFIGSEITLSLQGTDKNSNPVAVDAKQVSYSVSGITGTFSGNMFTPSSAGKGQLIAEVAGVKAAVEIEVADKPTGLLIEPSCAYLAPGTSQHVKVYGVNAEGYKVLINNKQVTWTSDNNQIQVTDGIVTTSAATTQGKIMASYRGAAASAGVIAGSQVIPLESFEENTGQYVGSSSALQGKVFPVQDIKYHGNKSLKMTYTFKASPAKQVAYTVLDKPVTIPTDAASLNMWVYGRNQGHAVKVQMIDATGKTYALRLIDAIQFNGWKYATIKLPEEMVLPAKLTKCYVYADSMEQEMTTALYLDHVSITRGFREAEGSLLRADYLADPQYKPSLQGAIQGQSIINVTGPTKSTGGTISSKAVEEIARQLSQGSSMVIKASTKNSPLDLTTESMTYTNSYQVNTYASTKVIMLGTGTGSMRTTQADGWTRLQADVENSEGIENLILITSMNPLTQFTDELEGQAFHQYLTQVKEATGKNIFVIYGGELQPEVRLEGGIRYIRTNGVNAVTDNYQDGSFVKIKVEGSQVYYTIEKFKSY